MIFQIAAFLSVALSGTPSGAPSGAPSGTGSVDAPRCVDALIAGSDYMYTFTAAEDKGSPTIGTVRVHGDRTRIDIADKKNGEYMLLTDGGTKMLSVHPDRREIDEISSPTFERIIGTSLRMVSPIVKFRVLNSRISSERVGTGQKLLGYSTEQIRLTERFDIRIVAMGFDAGTEHHTIITDYWVSPGLELGDNPLLVLIEHTGSAMAQTDRDFVQKEAAVRAQALAGTPLRTMVNETSVDDKGVAHTKVHSIDITSVKQGVQPASLFEVPSGYKVKAGMNFSA